MLAAAPEAHKLSWRPSSVNRGAAIRTSTIEILFLAGSVASFKVVFITSTPYNYNSRRDRRTGEVADLMGMTISAGVTALVTPRLHVRSQAASNALQFTLVGQPCESVTPGIDIGT